MNDELRAKLWKSREAENQRKRRVAKKRAAKSPSPNSEVKKQKIRNEKIEERKLKKVEAQRKTRAAKKVLKQQAPLVETVLVDSDSEEDSKDDSDDDLFVERNEWKLRKLNRQRCRRACLLYTSDAADD